MTTLHSSDPASYGTQQTPGDAPLSDHEPLRILLVDDDEIYLRTLEKVLRQDPHYTYEPVRCYTATEAIDLYEAGNIDLILIDYNLPDMTGAQCLSQMRAIPQKGHFPPSIICTAEGSEEAATSAIRAHADDYLPKRYINKNSLARSIHNVIEKHRLRRAIEAQYQTVNTLNEQLQKQNREIKQFYHHISHEVKTPLSAAREFVSLVRDGVHGPVNSDQADVLDMALSSCDNITQHFKDLVDITRLELKGLTLDRSDTPIKTVIERSLASCSELIRGQNATVNIDTQPDTTIHVDANRIVQVLSNLISNAVKYSGDQPVITIVTQPHNESTRFAVSDNGPGIDPKDHELIFERLGRSQKAHTECLGAGLGLGLSIAKEIVHLHEGELWLDSEPGAGSTFYFTTG